MKSSALLAIACVSVLACAPSANAATKIGGSSTVYNAVVTPNLDAVKKSTGVEIEAEAGGSGKGMIELMEGHLDMAMSSVGLEFHKVGESEMYIAVNAKNKVQKVTAAQLKDILSGKTTNWKDVGGADAPIAVYSDAAGAGSRMVIKKAALGESDFGANTKVPGKDESVAGLVAKDENGIGGVTPKQLKEDTGLKKIETGKKFAQSLYFVTSGEPTAEQTKVIKAFKAKFASGK